jgi:hypothetical protein
VVGATGRKNKCAEIYYFHPNEFSKRIYFLTDLNTLQLL